MIPLIEGDPRYSFIYVVIYLRYTEVQERDRESFFEEYLDELERKERVKMST